MSSVLLYVAIVVMWLCVLVPMWLRRDRTTLVEVVEAYETAEPYAPDEQPVEDELPEAEPRTVPATDAPTARPAATATTGAPAARPAAIAAAPAHRPMWSAADRRRAEQRHRRALQVAKRRRLTLWCVLLLLASVVTAAVRVIPWWGVAPSVVLLGAYLAVLRVSVQIDAENRRAAAQARAERARRARRRAELEPQRPVAQIIDLDAHRDEIFDQYAETPRRAVGD
ncbi:hypothetical protein [Streptosporangium sp. NPDC000396]|uniref:divisome protein SepX/GlpR n=1 Tax=Streptosporangium sp. NPDC000396 TaxID=3366185 RepID=UPI0036791767